MTTLLCLSEKNREENSLNHFGFGHVEVERSSLIFIYFLYFLKWSARARLQENQALRYNQQIK